MLRLAGRNTKAVRQLELTYGGGKTHTLVALRHLAHDPASLSGLPAVEQFRSDVGAPLPPARVAALAFDKLDVEKGMEVRGPDGELRWLKHPWSVLAFQLAGAAGLRGLHAEGRDEERETAPAEPLLVDLLSRPQADGLATLVLIDEVLMFARGKVAVDEAWRGRLTDFFQYLCQAVTKVDRCALVASLLASDLDKSDDTGKAISAQIGEIFNRQKEEGVQPVQKEDVAEVLRRRFFTPASIGDSDVFLPHVTTAVRNLAAVDDVVRKDRRNAEERFARGYPFHPDLTDLFYVRWTQLRPVSADARHPADVRHRAARRRELGHVAPGRPQRVPAGARPRRHRRGGPRADRRRDPRGDREPRARLGGDTGRRARQGAGHSGRAARTEGPRDRAGSLHGVPRLAADRSEGPDAGSDRAGGRHAPRPHRAGAGAAPLDGPVVVPRRERVRQRTRDGRRPPAAAEGVAARGPAEPEADAPRRLHQPGDGGGGGIEAAGRGPRDEEPDARHAGVRRARAHAARAAPRRRGRRRVPLRRPAALVRLERGTAQPRRAPFHRRDHRPGPPAHPPQRRRARGAVDRRA